MNKELTPLEALRRIRDYEKLPSRNPILYLLEQENLPTYYKVIETALKEHYIFKQDYERVMKEKNDLLKEHIKNEKKLKALEIIKEKGIVIQFIKETNLVEQYNAVISGYLLKPLTQEEYDLLKEVLL